MRVQSKVAGPAARPRLIDGFTPAAHRGASLVFPENTIEAFRRALEVVPGCLLETDVRRTRDGRIVVMHDECLEHKTDGQGPVCEKTLSEVQALNAGYRISFDGGVSYPFRAMHSRIPSLDEALDAFPGVRFSIDVKDDDLDAAELTASVVNRARANDRVIIGTFHDRIIRFFRKNHPYLATSFSKKDIIRFVASQKIRLTGLAGRPGDAIFMPEFSGRKAGGPPEARWSRGIRIITPGLIRAAHRKGIPVLAWTINSPEGMHRLIDWGIDGIVTDRIDLLGDIMKERGI